MTTRRRHGTFACLLVAFASCAQPDYAACERNEDCAIAWTTCGGGEPVVAVHHALWRQRFDQLCPDGCTICPCPIYAEYVATCAEGQCRAIHLLEAGLASCESDDECAVRLRRCCAEDRNEHCGGHVTVGFRADRRADVESLVCSSGSRDCSTGVFSRPACVDGACAAVPDI